MDMRNFRAVKSFVGWLLAFLAAAAAAGLLFLGDNDALAQSDAIDSGSAETTSARLEAWLDTNERDRLGSSRDRNGPDEWKADFAAEGPSGQLDVDGGFNVPGKGEILREWDGATVTCYLWGDTVIGVKLPDGTVLKSDQIGWRGTITRYAAGVFALGIALLIGGAKLRMGFLTGFVGGVLMAAVVVVMLHLNLLWVALAIDLVVVLAVGLFVARRRRRAKAGGAQGSDDSDRSPDEAAGPPSEDSRPDDGEAPHRDRSLFDS